MTDLDVGAAYAAGRERVVGLVADLPAARASMPVPACPEWRIQDVLAHVSGVCVDILAGRLDGAGPDPWTETQGAARRDRSIDEIVAEWNEAALQVEPIAKDFGPAGKQWVFDFSTHEHDIRGALERPGARDADTWWIALDFLTPAFLAGTWEPEGVEPVETLTADPFEFGRAITGRRSLDQIRAFEWSTDPELYLASFTLGPFTPRSTDLAE
jgi:hypothetical protein